MNKPSIQLLGHATFKVLTPEGKIIIIDPWLSDNEFIPASFRMQDKIDLMLVTHGHEDHFDKDIINILDKTKAKVIANGMCRWYLLEKGVPAESIEAMNIGGTIAIMDTEITMVNAFHIAHIMLPGGKIGYSHSSVGFVVKLSDGITIYFAGDTSVFGDMKLIGEIYKPDIAVLPIGDRYTMGPKEAAHAIRLLNVRHVIPCHYGTFSELTGTPQLLKEQTNNIQNLDIHVLVAGEIFSLTSLK